MFDSAYQGFASGDLKKDAYAVDLFTKSYDRILLCQSFAKNFGIYGERAGTLSVVTGSKTETEVVMSRLKQIARPIWSNPPIHGARLINVVLENPELVKEWHRELKVMSGRMFDMRQGLYNKILQSGSKHNWKHIVD
jgi:aspartate/tyrosine/aromatic aminotransferase